MTQPLQPNLLGLAMAPAEAIVQRDKIMLVEHAVARAALTHAMQDADVLEKFCSTYRAWIDSSRLNSFQGLDQFGTAAYSSGTSEAFDKFYMKHHHRRFRCFQGEYLYHRLTWQRSFDWAVMTDGADIAVNDAVVVSVPFADTGNVPKELTTAFLDRCAELGVPVLIDCAFFGICGNIKFDFGHSAITDVCFSLSKSFPVNLLRIGIRFTRTDDSDSLLVYHKSQYVNRLGAAVGLALLATQSPDHEFEQWRARQLEFCQQMQLEPSNTVIFGIDCDHRYDQYNRGSVDTNRICFSRYFESGVLPNVGQ
jgi:hypothetical protein